MTANQLVALNLRKAREEMGWTQEKAAKRLWEYLGTEWSKASFSSAERSAYEGARTRNFDANELLAFTQVFNKQLSWFFEPPDDETLVYCGAPLEAQRAVGAAGLRAARGTSALVQSQVRKIREHLDVLESATPAAEGDDDE